MSQYKENNTVPKRTRKRELIMDKSSDGNSSKERVEIGIGLGTLFHSLLSLYLPSSCLIIQFFLEQILHRIKIIHSQDPVIFVYLLHEHLVLTWYRLSQ
jgi:hypothetical protein